MNSIVGTVRAFTQARKAVFLIMLLHTTKVFALETWTLENGYGVILGSRAMFAMIGCFLVILVIASFFVRRYRIKSLRKLEVISQKLNDSNNKLYAVQRATCAVTWTWDLIGDKIYYDRPELLGEQCVLDEKSIYSLTEEQYYNRVKDKDRDKVTQTLALIRSGLKQNAIFEYRLNTFDEKSDDSYWVEAHVAVAASDEEGKPLTLKGILINVSERKKLQEALVFEKKRAEEFNRLKSTFFSSISHEIRTPLNAIVGFSTILLETEDINEKREYAKIIEYNNELLLQLISDIVDFSKIESGMFDITYSTVDLNDLMRGIENLVIPKLKTTDINLQFEPSMPTCLLRTDKNRLGKLLLHLLTNAAKFTDCGTIRFGYKLHQENMLYFYVSDSGCGIPESKVKDIFERFVKLNSFTQGTGLGLPICRVIVQQMGGEIGVKSEVGKGSTFWFTLPYCHERDS